jgi:hypothetical protein
MDHKQAVLGLLGPGACLWRKEVEFKDYWKGLRRVWDGTDFHRASKGAELRCLAVL